MAPASRHDEHPPEDRETAVPSRPAVRNEEKQTESVSISALRRARRVVGDDRILAHRLHVPVDDLRRWLAGEQSPPPAVFLAAVDVVMETPGMFRRGRSA